MSADPSKHGNGKKSQNPLAKQHTSNQTPVDMDQFDSFQPQTRSNQAKGVTASYAPTNMGFGMAPQQRDYMAEMDFFDSGNKNRVIFQPKTIYGSKVQSQSSVSSNKMTEVINDSMTKQASYTLGSTEVITKGTNDTSLLAGNTIPTSKVISSPKSKSKSNTNSLLETNETGFETIDTINIDTNETAVMTELEAKFEELDIYQNSDEKPLLFNITYCSPDSVSSTHEPDALRPFVVKTLKMFVENDTVNIDWHPIDKFSWHGRIYKSNTDSSFRCTIYEFGEDDESFKTKLEVRRNGGESFLFEEFRTLFLGEMSDDKAINYEKGPAFTMEHGFLSDDFCQLPDMSDLPPLGDDGMSDLGTDGMSDLDDLGDSPFSSISNIAMEEPSVKQLVDDATDIQQYREDLRESVAALKNATENSDKLNELVNIPNICDLLLKPITGNDQIYDTLIIKSLLEVLAKLFESNKQIATKETLKTIESIQRQWEHEITHPYIDTPFFRSQQIQRICEKCARSAKS